jgi:hypothetical protein
MSHQDSSNLIHILYLVGIHGSLVVDRAIRFNRRIQNIQIHGLMVRNQNQGRMMVSRMRMMVMMIRLRRKCSRWMMWSK